MAAPENTPKPNFATRPKRNFDQVKCLEDQTRVLTRRTVSGPRWGRTGERKRGIQVYTPQVHNLVTMLLCPRFETKHGTHSEALMLTLINFSRLIITRNYDEVRGMINISEEF